MSYPRPPGGLFPLTTPPTGRNAGGQYPLSAVLSDAIRSLAPTAYWKLDEASGNLADAMSGGYTATVTGSPTYGVAAPSPIGRGVTFSGTGQYATTSTSFPTEAAALSVFLCYATTYTSASAASAIARVGAWRLYNASGFHSFQLQQASTTGHAATSLGPSANSATGAWWAAGATFDTVTVRGYRGGQSGFLTPSSSTTLTGSWGTASGVAVGIAGTGAGAQLYPGTLAHVAIWSGRVVSEAEYRWLHAIAFGG